jgi:hypothetical protein
MYPFHPLNFSVLANIILPLCYSKKKKIKKEKGHGNCICGVWILGYFKRMYIKGKEGPFVYM